MVKNERIAVKLTISVFNKTQVVPAFLPKAFRIAELFECEVDIKCNSLMPQLPVGLDLLPIKTGTITELEVSVYGDTAREALSAIRNCISQCFCEVNYQMN